VVGTPEGEGERALGRPKHTWEDNINIKIIINMGWEDVH
jgi:hypothetical protein